MNNEKAKIENIITANDALSQNKEAFEKMTKFMLCYNEKVNLTRITEASEIREKHYIDSILPLIIQDVPRGTTALDIGSGAGFPGVPMKIYRGDLDITLLDSSKKRTDYLKLLVKEIGINCNIVTARSEILAHDVVFRGQYELVTARAVANLPALCEYCLPFVRVGGMFLALKGEKSEIESSEKAISLLGGKVERVIEYALPSGDRRTLITIQKVFDTPREYPRKRVNITKNPL